mmetsp:Transcript_566/g.1101  ORF Transcript_566/g.1101 Transcript_566/m.1101 type:complete len:82 (+) Transcript_566:310-555(+)
MITKHIDDDLKHAAHFVKEVPVTSVITGPKTRIKIVDAIRNSGMVGPQMISSYCSFKVTSALSISILNLSTSNVRLWTICW